MFYNPNIGQKFRFGDVILGQISLGSGVNSSSFESIKYQGNFDVLWPQFSIILTPCCSIGANDLMVISPLIKVDKYFFKNSYLREDLLRINELVIPEKKIPDEGWNRISEDEKALRISKGPGYTFLECYIYDKHESIPSYQLKISDSEEIEVFNYMIDFRNVTKIKVSNLVESTQLLNTRIAELTAEQRESLRKKLGFYYTNRPEEDVIDF